MKSLNMDEWSESRSIVLDSLRPHQLYSPWNSPGQNTGVGSLSLLQGIFPTQELGFIQFQVIVNFVSVTVALMLYTRCTVKEGRVK